MTGRPGVSLSTSKPVTESVSPLFLYRAAAKDRRQRCRCRRPRARLSGIARLVQPGTGGTTGGAIRLAQHLEPRADIVRMMRDRGDVGRQCRVSFRRDTGSESAQHGRTDRRREAMHCWAFQMVSADPREASKSTVALPSSARRIVFASVPRLLQSHSISPKSADCAIVRSFVA